ncbi:MAG: hypothetical protein J7J87_00520 [Candidatus Diapherotrites archaeon]|uniref:Uncharacterized protein n=1 Tax=Candidatus Iainarchaeum sp. TaxID=3101447 RepID=A0A497JJN9_9ARCH|nr:hypothetical protein [Candidatus Diapherotrites archaeon]RLG70157.1 MAG: hypothetical protein DRO07_00855 [Candidatus Diapherotrites archaeon]
MRKEKVFVVSEKSLQLVRLIGSFMIFGALILIFQQVAIMFDTWDGIKEYPKCMAGYRAYISDDNADPLVAQLKYNNCNDYLYKKTNVALAPGNTSLSGKQLFLVFIRPVVGIFFWAVVFFTGILLYNCRRLSFLVEESTHEKIKKGKK